MGYYAAGGGAAFGLPDWTTYGNAPSAPLPGLGAPGAQAQEGPYRPKRRVLDLTALARAERRIERASKVAARLFRHKKVGHHGLLFRKKKRK